MGLLIKLVAKLVQYRYGNKTKLDIFVQIGIMESKRQKQISELIKRNFSIILQQEGIYIFGDSLVSVTNVIVSSDLRLAKIYLSIFNAEDKEGVLTAVRKNIGSLKQSLVARIRKQVRFIPEIAIYNDDLLDEMYNVSKLLEDI
jgi:ribosome-binding factor A